MLPSISPDIPGTKKGGIIPCCGCCIGVIRILPALLPLIFPSPIIGCIGALLIVTAAIATPIAKTQQTREIWFYAMSGGAVLKILTVEIARIVH